MFQFLDRTAGSQGAFQERTRSGLIIPKLVTTQKGERWAKVVAAGPGALDAGIKVDDFILIDALMWMEAVKFGGEKVWMTNATKILAVTNDEKSTIVW